MKELNTTDEIKNNALKDLALLIYRGESLKKAAKIVSDKYKNEYANLVPEKTLKELWKEREEWLMDVFEINKESILEQLLTEQMYIKGQLYDLIDDAIEVSEKRLILKDINNLNQDFIGMLVDMGIIEKQPDRLEITGQDGGALEISSLAKVAEDWDEEEVIDVPNDDSSDSD